MATLRERLPPARHPLAERPFKAVHDVEQAHHPCGVSQADRAHDHIREIQVIQGEVGGGLSWVQLLPMTVRCSVPAKASPMRSSMPKCSLSPLSRLQPFYSSV